MIDEVDEFDDVERGDLSAAALLTGSLIAAASALTVLVLVFGFAGKEAFDATMHGASHSKAVSQAASLISSMRFSVASLVIALLGTAAGGFTCGRMRAAFDKTDWLLIGIVSAASAMAVGLISPLGLPVWTTLIWTVL